MYSTFPQNYTLIKAQLSKTTTMHSQNIFPSVEEAVKALKLDRRHKWFEFMGELVYPYNYSAPCSGCSCDCSDGHGCNHGNSGCHECGYSGKRRSSVPIYATGTDGNTVKIKPPTNE